MPSEYRFDREPLGALQGMAPNRVIYIGTGSKTLSPALRLGWLLASPGIAAELAALKQRADGGSSVAVTCTVPSDHIQPPKCRAEEEQRTDLMQRSNG